MDRDLLSRLIAEVNRHASGTTIAGVICRPGHGLALLLEGQCRRALDLAPGPPRPRLALTGVRLRAVDAPHAGLVGRLRKQLDGASLASAELLQGERIARIVVPGRGALVLEVLGGAANLIWLGADNRVLLVFRRTGRPGGVLTVGEPWYRPAGRDGSDAGEVVWERPLHPPAPRPGILLDPDIDEASALAPLSPRSVVTVSEGPEDAAQRFEATELLGDAVLRREFLLADREDTRRRLGRLDSAIRRARTKLLRLQEALRSESAAAADPGRVRRQAEALLAGLSVARREGDELVVPDPWAADGAPVRLRLDPGVPARVHADRLFRQAARMERISAEAVVKEETAARRAATLEELERAIEGVRDPDDLSAIEARAGAILPARKTPARPGRKRDRPPGRRLDPRDRKIRRFKLSEDWHVLVGGNGADNDYLTFKLAAAHDFWLHAADYPGAHVVVRNPGRRTDLPDAVLRQAAAIAAHFSKVPGTGSVDVRWTQVRYVRKPRGRPAGAVLLPRFSTLTVEPAPPPRGDRPA